MSYDWSTYKGNLKWLPTRTVLLVKHGSHAYGLNTLQSDLDIKGIAIPPQEYFLGWLKRFEQAESKNPDMSIYDIRKFFQLATDCNPNIIEVLWGEDEDVIEIGWVGKFFRHFKTAFLSQKARHTFSGYAHAQLKRIKTHKKWLLKSPSHKPERAEFDLPQTTIISKDIMGAIQNLEDKSALAAHEDEFGPAVMQAYQRERAYHNALREWNQFLSWKANRNPARAESEKQFGYDTKHAMHLVRLMRMCREILTDGKVIVKRPDREELLAIRRGAWSYELLMEWAERQDGEMADLAKQTKLPHSPDRDYLDGLCRAWVAEYFRQEV